MTSRLYACAGPLLLVLALAMGAQTVARAQAVEDAAADYQAMESPPISEPYGNAWSGAADGDVTLVIFADYGCPPCREAQKVTDRLIAEDPKLRVVYRIIALDDLPGRAPAYASLDAAAEEIYVETGSDAKRVNTTDWNAFHRALMAKGAVTRKSIATVVSALGIPSGVVLLDHLGSRQSDDFHPNAMTYQSELGGNAAELADRGGESLPAWAIGDGQVTEGHDYAEIKAAIAKARAAASD